MTHRRILASLAAVAALIAASGPAHATTARRGPLPALARTAVAWSKVGPGWFLAVESSATCAPCDELGPSTRGPGTASLLLVSPSGSRYRIADWPDTNGFGGPQQLEAWSGDGRRALFLTRGTPDIVTEIDLHTGRSHHFPLRSDTSYSPDEVGYTAPDGLGITVSRTVFGSDGFATPEQLYRVDRAGGHPVTLADLPSTAGSWLYAPDGRSVVVGMPTGITIVSNTGGVLGSRAVPGATDCEVARWWDAHDVLASCSSGAFPRLWLVPVGAAGSPRAITPVRPFQGVDNGDLNAWTLPSGLYLQVALGCGVLGIGKQAADGSVRVLTVPGNLGDNVAVLGRDGDSLDISVTRECAPGATLARFDPASGHVTKLLSGPPATVGVLSVLAYPRG